MTAIALYVRAISRVNLILGHVLSWLAFACVIACFTIVVQRYFFNTSTLWLRDLYVWVAGAMFTGVAGFALLRNDHVRVDIFYRPAPVRKKAIVDLIGVVFLLLPFCYVVWHYGWVSIVRSWNLREASSNVGGMPGLFVLKTFIMIFVVTVGGQGLAIAGRSILVLARREDLLPESLRYPSDTAPNPATPEGAR